MSTKAWDPGTGPLQPGPVGLLQWLRRGRAGAGPTPGRPSRLAGVLFDMDGLLVDSEPVWSVAEAELATRLGGVWTPEIKQAMIGHHIDAAIPIMLAMLGSDADVAAATDFLLTRVTELFRAPGRLILQPGALELLDAVRAGGVPAALVSSSYRQLVDAALDVIGRGRFAVTVAGDEITRAKPDPEPYRTAAARLGADPARCVVLEDSETGARSGVAAGCPTVLVPTFPPAVPPSGVTVVATLREVTLDGLAALAD